MNLVCTFLWEEVGEVTQAQREHAKSTEPKPETDTENLNTGSPSNSCRTSCHCFHILQEKAWSMSRSIREVVTCRLVALIPLTGCCWLKPITHNLSRKKFDCDWSPKPMEDLSLSKLSNGWKGNKQTEYVFVELCSWVNIMGSETDLRNVWWET